MICLVYYNIMKLITRTNHIKNHVPIPDIIFVSTPINQQLPDNKHSNPSNTPQQHYQANNRQFLNPNIESPANCVKSLKDKSVTTRIESNNIYDSVKNPMTHSDQKDFKILTLKQLRRHSNPSEGKQLQGNNNRSLGICVSMSRSKNNSNSRDKCGQDLKQKHYNNQKNPYFKCLSYLSKKGQLLDRLETHISKKQQGAHFC